MDIVSPAGSARRQNTFWILFSIGAAVLAVGMIGWNWWPVLHLVFALVLILVLATSFYVQERELNRIKVRLAKEERLAAIEELERSENRFRSLIENAADMMLVYDHRMRITEVNRQACIRLGYERDELLRKTISEIEMPVTEVDRPELQEQLVQGQPITAESSYRRKDGSTFQAEVRVALLQVGGRPLKLALVRDITERKQTERALEEQRNLLSNIIDNIPCAVFWKGPDLVYRGCNTLFARSCGLISSVDVVGKSDSDLMPDKADAISSTRSDRDLLRIGRPILNVEERWRISGGPTAYVLLSKVPLTLGDGPGILGIFSDITERKRSEERSRQSQKMQAIGQLAGGVAHDFNNLLTAINGYTQLVMEGLKPDDPASEHLREVIRAGDRAAGLTRQLLAYSRRQVLQPKVVDLNSVIGNLERMLRRLIGEDIELVTRLEANLRRVEVDPGQFEQVVMNLVVNARDAMPGGGGITIVTSNVDYEDLPVVAETSMGQPVPHVLVEVRDNGTGMDAQTKSRIFEPFYTTKEVGTGTGLGLATVHGIVKQSGGFISVESEPNKGSTFFVYFPAADGEAEASSISHAGIDKSLCGSETVLLVEDEPGLRSLTRILLQRSGFNVLEAAAGHEAIQIAASHMGRIDVLLTDVVMPRMSGRQLAESLRTIHPHTKVLYMSGYTNDAILRHGVQASTAALLEKPFTAKRLITKLRSVLNGGN